MTKTEDDSNQLASSVNSDSKMEDKLSGDMCRVCRSEGTADKPLYYPCVCTGSIKYIHQDCLVQWLRYSKKEYCELCKHRYTFTPIYAPDMPKRLPIGDIVMGLMRGMLRAVRYWLHYTLVAVAWLGIVPLTACRIYRCLFTGSINALLTLPLDMLATENMVTDCFQGCFIVTCTLCTFISLVWLREQILHGGGPDWLDRDVAAANHRQNPAPAAPDRPAAAEPVIGAAAAEPANAAAAVAEPEAVADNAEADSDDDDSDEEDEDEDEEGNNANGGIAADINNWNPIEWDRAAEELTWERLLGLDGSLLFLEHVFWVVSLNTLFILIFAFCPYHIGRMVVSSLNIQIMISATQFEGALTTMAGYIVIGFTLIVLHFIGSLARLKTACRIFGLCYVAVKVSLLVIVEIGLFPLICGWWLDICSLNMFDATLKDREHNFRMAPGTSMFIHWLIGMVYIFYFASFILLLREVLRPGLLWFLRNINDPDFNPIQEMIHLSVYRHVRRFLASMVVFGTIILIMLWLPVQLIRKLFPSFLPFHIMLSGDMPVSELSLELLLLQVILPALLEQGHTRQWLRGLIRGWCVCTAWLLDLRSYLLGDEPQEVDNARNENQAQNAEATQNPAAEPANAEAAAADNDVPADIDSAAAEIVAAATAAAVGAVAADSIDQASLIDQETSQNLLAKLYAHVDTDVNSASLMQSDITRASNDKIRTVEDYSNGFNLTNPMESQTLLGAYAIDSLVMSDDCGMAGSSVDGVAEEDYNMVALSSSESSLNEEDLVARQLKSKCYLEDTSLLHNDNLKSSLETETDCVNGVNNTQARSSGLCNTNAQLVENSQHVVAEHLATPVQPVGLSALPLAQPTVQAAPIVPQHVGLPAQPVGVPAQPVGLPAQPAGLPEPPEAQPIAQPLGQFAALPAQPAQNNMPRAQAVNRNINQRPARPELAQLAPMLNMALGDAHQAMLQGGGPLGFQPYQPPDMFALRLVCLVLLMCVTLFLASLASFTLPVFVGRRLMSVWTGEVRIHELYTAACGLYMCWVALRISMVFYTWIPQGWNAISEKIFEWTLLVSKSLFIAVVLIGIVPLMLGVIFELVMVIPVRVPLEQSPMFFLWQDWALGVLHAKIITAATMMGPPWRLKHVIEQVYNQGIRQMDLKYIMVELCLPVLVCLGLILAVPMIISKSIVPALGFDMETQNLVYRRIYPCLLGIITFISFCVFQARQFRRLYEHIRNDKYLVGQRLVNYERKAPSASVA